MADKKLFYSFLCVNEKTDSVRFQPNRGSAGKLNTHMHKHAQTLFCRMQVMIKMQHRPDSTSTILLNLEKDHSGSPFARERE